MFRWLACLFVRALCFVGELDICGCLLRIGVDII